MRRKPLLGLPSLKKVFKKALPCEQEKKVFWLLRIFVLIKGRVLGEQAINIWGDIFGQVPKVDARLICAPDGRPLVNQAPNSSDKNLALDIEA